MHLSFFFHKKHELSIYAVDSNKLNIRTSKEIWRNIQANMSTDPCLQIIFLYLVNTKN